MGNEKKKALTPTRAAALAADVARGMTHRQVADKYGISPSTVRRILHGPDKDRTPAPPPQPCGTNAAYMRHLYKGELACPACLKAHTELNNPRVDPASMTS